MKVRIVLQLILLFCVGLALRGHAAQPNIILFTVDDMDVTSVNAYGNPLPDLTPNMDKLAAQGMRFMNAHVTRRSACRVASR